MFVFVLDSYSALITWSSCCVCLCLGQLQCPDNVVIVLSLSLSWTAGQLQCPDNVVIVLSLSLSWTATVPCQPERNRRRSQCGVTSGPASSSKCASCGLAKPGNQFADLGPRQIRSCGSSLDAM